MQYQNTGSTSKEKSNLHNIYFLNNQINKIRNELPML